MTTTSAAPCPLHPWIAQPCNICTTTFSVAPAQSEPQDYDALVDALNDADAHPSSVNNWRDLVGEAATAIAALRAENERQAREIAELREEFAKVDRLWKQAEIARERAETTLGGMENATRITLARAECAEGEARLWLSEYNRLRQEIADATARCVAHLAERDALRADAERYRTVRDIVWWRTDPFAADTGARGIGYWQTKLFKLPNVPSDKEQFDAAIDAARGK